MTAGATSSTLFTQFIQYPRHLHTSGSRQMHMFDTQQHSWNPICTVRSGKSVPDIKASPRRHRSDSQSIYSYSVFDFKRLEGSGFFSVPMTRFLNFLSNIFNLYRPYSGTIHSFHCESAPVKEKRFSSQHQWWLKEKHEAALPGESHPPIRTHHRSDLLIWTNSPRQCQHHLFFSLHHRS